METQEENLVVPQGKLERLRAALKPLVKWPFCFSVLFYTTRRVTLSERPTLQVPKLFLWVLLLWARSCQRPTPRINKPGEKFHKDQKSRTCFFLHKSGSEPQYKYITSILHKKYQYKTGHRLAAYGARQSIWKFKI